MGALPHATQRESTSEDEAVMARIGLLTGTLLAILLLGHGAAWAEDEDEEPDYARSGAYLRGAGQLAVWTSRAGMAPAPQVEWQPDFGLDVALGWRESERFAIEIEFEWVVNHEDVSLGNWLLGVNGKFYFLEDRIQPYMINGVGAMWTKIPGAPSFADDWAFRHGLGVDFYLNNHWAITGESTFVWGVGDIWKNYFVTVGVGVLYRF